MRVAILVTVTKGEWSDIGDSGDIGNSDKG